MSLLLSLDLSYAEDFRMVLSKDGNKLITSSKNITIWNVNSGKILQVIEFYEEKLNTSDPLACVDFSNDSTKIVATSCYGKIKVWNVDNGILLLKLHTSFGNLN